MPGSNIPLSYATCSLGTTDTPLPAKLSALSSSGFTGIELAFPDLLSYASSLHNKSVSPTFYAELRTAASEVAKLCKTHNLSIMMLQPFSNFEGWPRGSPEREDAFARAKGWIGIMEAAGTDMLQVGSTDTPLDKLSDSASLRGNIIEDLRELAGLLDEKGMRLAYENWCWSSHAPDWKDVWEVVRDVDRGNVGLCLDTFQSAGGEWGDPTTVSGRVGGVNPGSAGEKDLSRRFEESMAELARTVPREKIYLLQVSDAYVPVAPGSESSTKTTKPLDAGVVDGTAPRGRWSHDYRPMPYDGGYLPIEAVGTAVLKTGFRGWFSMEIFDGGEDGSGKEYELGEFAGRAKVSMGKFIEKCEAQV
ncbi:hypothetical protein ASPSYDRAFT_289054 [Aspergillus sydowii CBS 593.65]|uniref:Xylose isomerase-like TIM barrel domain-containing protein n=1 Tax=Aspergillus sydowii CBS 593.65 TaxID=1036612 RepID=A0A1L9TXD0_9EURO|nr:uncharacterized protein ASPSYDRAFT_289054 [Aspergillus sydowii CBS 593.65]OJJ64101.1 hypothetical protein ASPSYDRAFT_289054 [Aspergillus sydowii CBS 593.65]